MIAIGSILSVILLVASACAVSSLPALFLLQGIFLGMAHAMSLPLVNSFFLRTSTHANCGLTRLLAVHDDSLSVVSEATRPRHRLHDLRSRVSLLPPFLILASGNKLKSSPPTVSAALSRLSSFARFCPNWDTATPSSFTRGSAPSST